jgi:hypothetical protein
MDAQLFNASSLSGTEANKNESNENEIRLLSSGILSMFS